MHAVGHAHLFGEQLVDHAVAHWLRLVGELLAHDVQPEVALNRVLRAAHTRVVRVHGTVVRDVQNTRLQRGQFTADLRFDGPGHTHVTQPLMSAQNSPTPKKP